jgi:hypothetical protein
MIYLENDFYSNFTSMVESNDEKLMNNMLVDQISNLIAFKKENLVSLFNKIGLKVSNNPTNKELSNIIAKNLKSNRKLQVGLAYLIAEQNNVLQQEVKKSRTDDDAINSFEGNEDKKTKEKKPRKPVDWNRSADAVTAISGSISVLADTITQTKQGQFANDLNTQSNVKSPEEIAQEKQNEINEAKRKRRRNIIIGVVVVGLVVTAIVGYKKGWFKKG